MGEKCLEMIMKKESSHTSGLLKEDKTSANSLVWFQKDKKEIEKRKEHVPWSTNQFRDERRELRGKTYESNLYYGERKTSRREIPSFDSGKRVGVSFSSSSWHEDSRHSRGHSGSSYKSDRHSGHRDFRVSSKHTKSPVKYKRYDVKSDKSPVRYKRYVNPERSPVKYKRYDDKPGRSPVKYKRYDGKPERSPVKYKRYDKSDRSPNRIRSGYDKLSHRYTSDGSPDSKRVGSSRSRRSRSSDREDETRSSKSRYRSRSRRQESSEQHSTDGINSSDRMTNDPKIKILAGNDVMKNPVQMGRPETDPFYQLTNPSPPPGTFPLTPESLQNAVVPSYPTPVSLGSTTNSSLPSNVLAQFPQMPHVVFLNPINGQMMMQPFPLSQQTPLSQTPSI